MVAPATEPLLAHLEHFVGFARRRLGDPDLAAEAVQESLARALAHAGEIRDEDRLVAWFWRILRNTIADQGRRHGAAATAAARLAHEPPEADDETEACACLHALLPSMKPEYAELIQRLDLRPEPPEQVAVSLGITRNNLKVRHHRARQQLRALLEQTCRLCAEHGCVDCTCDSTSGGPK